MRNRNKWALVFAFAKAAEGLFAWVADYAKGQAYLPDAVRALESDK